MLFYWFVWTLTKIVRIFLFSHKIIGGQNIPKKGPFILASNHHSYLDPIVIPISCYRRLSFVARETLFDHKWMGWFLRNIGGFPIKRKQSDIRAIKQIFNCLNKGRPILIFPEGTRHSQKDGSAAEAGVGLIAVKSGVPVIPAYVDGSERVLPPGSKKARYSLIKVTFGEPIYYSKGDSYQNVANSIVENIYKLSPKVQ